MPAPQDVHVDSALSNLSVAYKNTEAISDFILPSVTVTKQSSKYFIFGRDKYMIPATHRSPNTRAKEVTFTLSTDNYECKNYALQGRVSDEERANADNALKPDIDMAEEVTDRLILDKEKRAADLLFSTASFSQNTTLAGTNQWSDYTNSDPFGDIDTARQTVVQSVGVNPNVMILGCEVFDKLKHHPEVVDRVKYTQKAVTTADILASLFGVDNVLVGGMVYNSAAEGLSESMGFIWGKYCLMGYVSPRPGLKSLSMGYSIYWGEREVDRWRDEDTKSDIIRVNMYYDMKLACPQAGYLIKDAVA